MASTKQENEVSLYANFTKRACETPLHFMSLMRCETLGTKFMQYNQGEDLKNLLIDFNNQFGSLKIVCRLFFDDQNSEEIETFFENLFRLESQSLWIAITYVGKEVMKGLKSLLPRYFETIESLDPFQAELVIKPFNITNPLQTKTVFVAAASFENLLTKGM